VTTVTISFPNGNRQEVLLSGVPRVGDSIRLRDRSSDSPSLIVEHILWQEGRGNPPDPEIIVVVRERSNSPSV
jgi:hypothetical protein